MLLRTDNEGSNAWHIAAYGGKLVEMLKILLLAKGRLTAQEINNEILLSTDKRGKTPGILQH